MLLSQVDVTKAQIDYFYLFDKNIIGNACIHEFQKSCDKCQRASHYHPPKQPLHPLPVPNLFERLHLDYLGPLRTSSCGKKWILLVIDAFSGWTECFALESAWTFYGRSGRVRTGRIFQNVETTQNPEETIPFRNWTEWQRAWNELDVLRTEFPYFGPTRDLLQSSAVEHQL